MQTTVPAPAARDQSYVVERLEALRITFPTGRSSLVAKLQKPDANPDEMSFSDLRQFVAGSTGIAHREANIIFHKRLAFAMAPFVFSLFGSALALRMRRGSRGFGVLMSLLVFLLYYLVTLAGDQMARAGSLSPIVGGWTGTALALALGIILLAIR